MKSKENENKFEKKEQQKSLIIKQKQNLGGQA